MATAPQPSLDGALLKRSHDRIESVKREQPRNQQPPWLREVIAGMASFWHRQHADAYRTLAPLLRPASLSSVSNLANIDKVEQMIRWYIAKVPAEFVEPDAAQVPPEDRQWHHMAREIGQQMSGDSNKGPSVEIQRGVPKDSQHTKETLPVPVRPREKSKFEELLESARTVHSKLSAGLPQKVQSPKPARKPKKPDAPKTPVEFHYNYGDSGVSAEPAAPAPQPTSRQSPAAPGPATEPQKTARIHEDL
eukprot:TRINITY_DN8465_c0_g1_i1.p1 TRINITY_DN8465_c0_g1~~TRINITY_DN8465_c0_g1_i1.p1  ORF type:complete len:285 (-),score=44.12 TRINITY_DN8465_c0_g1_i1:11-757(-)